MALSASCSIAFAQPYLLVLFLSSNFQNIEVLLVCAFPGGKEQRGQASARTRSQVGTT